MLGLAARASVVHHQFLRHGAGEFGTVILFNHGQRQVDAGGHPGGRPDRTVDHVDAILFHFDRRKPRLQFPCVRPVRGRPTSFKQTRLGQHKGAGTDRRRTPCGLDAAAQVIQYPLGRLLENGIAADHDHRVEHPLTKRLGTNAQTTGGAQSAAVFRHHTHRIKRLASAEVGVFEHWHRRQRHGLEAFKHHKRYGSHCRLLKRICPENVL
ncbi:hypothetical protein D3C84_619130 [compost metagenome]